MGTLAAAGFDVESGGTGFAGTVGVVCGGDPAGISAGGFFWIPVCAAGFGEDERAAVAWLWLLAETTSR